jgi:hypothetical protein
LKIGKAICEFAPQRQVMSPLGFETTCEQRMALFAPKTIIPDNELEGI